MACKGTKFFLINNSYLIFFVFYPQFKKNKHQLTQELIITCRNIRCNNMQGKTLFI